MLCYDHIRQPEMIEASPNAHMIKISPISVNSGKMVKTYYCGLANTIYNGRGPPAYVYQID